MTGRPNDQSANNQRERQQQYSTPNRASDQQSAQLNQRHLEAVRRVEEAASRGDYVYHTNDYIDNLFSEVDRQRLDRHVSQ